MNLNVIRNITIRGTTQGVDETTSKLNRLAGAQENVAQVSDRSARAQLSVERALERIQRQFDASYRSAQQFAKVQSDLERARAQGLISQQRQTELLALAATRFDQVSRGQRAFITASQAANDNVRTLAASAGALGTTLSALGPAGVAAAAGLGAAVLVIHQMITAATNLAERAGKLKDFSETTGFTILELQALEKAGAQVGVSAESVSRALERFSAQMADVRLQTGETYEKLLAINPVLARQVAEANSLSRAYELVSDAIKKANLEQGNQLARAFFGRSGVEQTRLMRAVSEAGGLKGLIADLHQADLITKQQADRWDELGDKIAENMKAAKQNIASIFTEDVLMGMERFSKAFLELTRSVKEFGINEDLKKFLDFFASEAGRGLLAGSLTGAMVGGPVGAAVGGVIGLGAGAAVGQLNANDVRELREELEKLQLARSGAARKLIETDDVNMVRELPGIIQRLDQRITALKEKLPIQVTPKTTITVTKEFDQQAADAAKAQEDLKRNTIASYNEMARWMGVIGGAATMAERYELQTLKLKAAKAQGLITEEQYTRAIEDQKQRLEQQLGVLDPLVIISERLAQVREVAAKAGLTDEQTRLALIIAEREAREKANTAWARANPLMKELLDTSTQFFENFLQGIASGKSGIESLIGSLKGLGNQLMSLGSRSLNAGLQSAFSGGGFQGFLSGGGAQGLALAGIGMAVSGIMSNMERRRQRQQDLAQAQQESRRRIQDLQFQQQLVGIDTDTREGALQAFDIQTQQQMSGLVKSAGGFTVKTDEAKAVEELRRAQRLELIKRFDDQEIAEEKRRQEQLTQIRQDLRDRELAAANDNSTRVGALLEFDRNAARERAEIAKQSTSLLTQFDKTIAAERAALDKSLLDEIRQRKQSIQDEIFAVTNDPNTLAGQLAALDREFQRRREEEQKAGGEALLDLELLYQVRRNKIIQDSNDAALEEQKRAAQAFQEFIAGVRRNITEFIANLRAGPDSPLSPTARLAAAQASFAQQLTLAQGGDRDALTGITQFASNLFQAARGVFASGSGFQTIFDTVTAQLEALPDIAASADPIVDAIQQQTSDLTRDLLTPTDMTGALGATYASGTLAAQVAAMNATKASTDLVKTSTDTVANNVGDSNSEGLRSLVSTLNTLTLTNRDNTRILTAQSGALDQIVGNTDKAIYQYRPDKQDAGGNISSVWDRGTPGQPNVLPKPTFALGGIAMPGMDIVFGEHHPMGPWVGRVGRDPIAITPGMPPEIVGAGNDNREVVVELRFLRREVARLTQWQTRVLEESDRRSDAIVRHQTHKFEQSQRETSQRDRVKRKLAS